MKNNTRRRFLINTSLATGGLLIAGRIGASMKNEQAGALLCAPDSVSQLTGTISSVKSGNWSDASTWGGRIPAAADTPVIGSTHTINFDVASTTVAGVNINSGGTLSFDTTKSTTLQSTKNILLQGKLQMRPGSASVIQTIRFTGINEGIFVGGGMDPLDSDVGLWVMGNGIMDIQGSNKKSWTNATSSLSAGASTISVSDASGWNVNDEIVIAPSEKPDSNGNYTKGEERTIKAISGNTITLSSALSKEHPSASYNGKTKYTEVMNLTRNVMVEGTPTGNSHIFIHAATKHSISNMQMRFMGPRKNTGGDAEKEFVPGRYGLHFHHAGEGSRGTMVTGCVVRDTGSHAFVPHVSHGITFKDCVSYKTKEAAYWVDEGDPSHSITYNNCIAGDIGFVPRSMTFEDPTSPSFGTHGFLLGVGDDCTCTNCVVWGQVSSEDFGAFTWQANNEGVWKFDNNLAHNSVQGIWVWQNTTKNHIIDKFTAYNCQNGFLHGAYANSYTFNQCEFFNCNIRFQANSSDAGLHLKDSFIDAGGLHDYAIDSRFGRVDSSYPIQIIGCTLKGYRQAPLFDTNGAGEDGAWIKKMYDMVNCTFAGLPMVQSGASGEIVRVQNQNGDGKAYTISPGNVKKDIAFFAPQKYGTGTGLKGEYFNNAALSGTATFVRVDAPIAFQEWSFKSQPAGVAWIDYRITSNSHSMRWTGQIQPQYSEAYTFYLSSMGNTKMWVNGAQVINNSTQSSAISMVANQLYDIKIEYTNTDNSSGVNLFWESKSQVRQYIPQSQMYADTTGVIPPANQGPISNAGTDIVITLPTNSTTLVGTASSDSDGSIASNLWTRVSGPTQFGFANANSASTVVNNLVEGTYVFRLQVTDNKGATATDDVMVTVNAATSTQQTLNITASPNPTTNSWRLTVTSSSSGSITVTILDNQGNVKETHRNLPNNATGLVGASYPKGTYVAVAEQGTEKKTIQIIKM